MGRTRELAELTSLLASHRLVTLWGPGGIGKTRLADEIARQASARGAAAWVVPLGGRHGPAVIARRLRDMGVDVRGDGPALALQRAADGRPGLVLLDECEAELDQAADFVTDVLRRTAGLRVVATSRRPLDVQGEQLFAVPPMLVGAAASWSDRTDAIRLFLERLPPRRATTISSADRRTIFEICRRVDGVPLAIELAARLSQTIGAEAVLARLGSGSILHAPLGRDAPAHKRTIAATIDLSLALLEDDARGAFQRLAVFAGTFDLDAAGKVTGAGVSVERLLNQLVDHSLVIEDRLVGERRRFRLLEPTRERALELLTGSGQLEPARERHARFYRTFVETLALPGPDEQRTFDRLGADVDNVRVALEWHDRRDPTAVPNLVARLTPFWARRGHLEEARRWLDAALGRDGTASARLLNAQATVLGLEGRFDDARRSAELAAAAARREHDDAAEARAWASVAQMTAPDIAPARRAFALAKAAAQRAGATDLLAEVNAEHAGIEWAAGDELLAVALAHEVAHTRETEPTTATLVASTILARRALFGGDPNAANRWRELVQRSRPLRDPLLTSTCLSFLSLALARDGNDRAAAAAMAEAGELVRRSGSPPARLQHAENAGLLLMRTGRPFLGLILVLAKERLAGPEWIDSRAYWQFVRTEIASALDSVDVDPHAEAMALGPDAAFARAVEAVDEVARTARDRSRTSTTRLSGRERRVAELIAAGHTNGEIAHQLAISERTVEAHVRHILDKLGLANRTQVARWVLASAGSAAEMSSVRVPTDGGHVSRR